LLRRQEYLIDDLVDYQVEPDDRARLVPNPARKALDKELRLARASFTKLHSASGAWPFTMSTETCPEPISGKQKRNSAVTWRRSLPVSRNWRRGGLLSLSPAFGQGKRRPRHVKLSTERKHLTNILKMVAFQIESDLVEMIRPHYKRAEDEGRTLVQTILRQISNRRKACFASRLPRSVHPIARGSSNPFALR
jgi:hypothetical protein